MKLLLFKVCFNYCIISKYYCVDTITHYTIILLQLQIIEHNNVPIFSRLETTVMYTKYPWRMKMCLWLNRIVYTLYDIFLVILLIFTVSIQTLKYFRKLQLFRKCKLLSAELCKTYQICNNILKVSSKTFIQPKVAPPCWSYEITKPLMCKFMAYYRQNCFFVPLIWYTWCI